MLSMVTVDAGQTVSEVADLTSRLLQSELERNEFNAVEFMVSVDAA